ncbi:fumarylacetoacetate hydrolase family protein [Oceanobacter mangrovi]|uniref:fumarylacetoacetate hydrolase family protein n=1 Tax=Oceanobacter mangrovi TaxID=2862510 RepID=UPI001C8D6420|nr:fumarylacetoacetate hydrolase family protein [Oceanobacter mangrovi]
MDWSFGELLAHLALNRNLRAGTVLGFGTVSNENAERVGSACLAEWRALEVIRFGAPKEAFLAAGERMAFAVLDAAGASVFGAIDYVTRTFD